MLKYKHLLQIHRLKIIFFFFTIKIFSQNNVGINTTGALPDNSALLDLISKKSGLLLPRMTTTERDAINSPAQSLLIFNTDTLCFQTYVGGQWNNIWCNFTCGTTVNDIDGNTYNSILIGTQCWLKENLKVENNPSNSLITRYCYDNNSSNCNIYGGLYTWTTMMNGYSSCNGIGSSQPECSNIVQGICPDNWHIPSHYEWTLLEKNLGTNSADFLYNETSTGSYGTDEGRNLKEDAEQGHWISDDGVCNESGFTALPGACRHTNGSFNNLKGGGFWWSATEYDVTNAWHRTLNYSIATVVRDHSNKNFGFSIRCVKD